MIVGSLNLSDGAPVVWQQSTGSDGLLETDWSDLAGAFSALGHPGRLKLIRHILSGVHATAELSEIASLGTTGKLHHHLRQLVAAGWVRQSAIGASHRFCGILMLGRRPERERCGDLGDDRTTQQQPPVLAVFLSSSIAAAACPGYP
ncbi:ArsR/SmtB family transcription factor [Gulosibacter sp. ACHW.36C]|uniref:Winged helix-turn-helix domain-containing protein n=1 Tax=Gulosibacter sediminis TaxID=1729695 RepID=A0ABY4MZG0_9MICO|nr:winged helix-turn-helix domain-containing protein [Gulosibacter sediminis]UQN15774.1 winged helix-turn-helix domain-containing protein [Gulosibacter sediminis]